MWGWEGRGVEAGGGAAPHPLPHPRRKPPGNKLRARIGSHINVYFSSVVPGRSMVSILGYQPSVFVRVCLFGMTWRQYFYANFSNALIAYDRPSWKLNVSVRAHVRAQLVRNIGLGDS